MARERAEKEIPSCEVGHSSYVLVLDLLSRLTLPFWANGCGDWVRSRSPLGSSILWLSIG